MLNNQLIIITTTDKNHDESWLNHASYDLEAPHDPHEVVEGSSSSNQNERVMVEFQAQGYACAVATAWGTSDGWLRVKPLTNQ